MVLLTGVTGIWHLVCARPRHDSLCRRLVVLPSLHPATQMRMGPKPQRLRIQTQVCLASRPMPSRPVTYGSLCAVSGNTAECALLRKKHTHLSRRMCPRNGRSGSPAGPSGVGRAEGRGWADVAGQRGSHSAVKLGELCLWLPSPGATRLCQQPPGLSPGTA